ncbi:hypothetical protein JCM8097_000995 [Rhodosporidiobolus ruineniae]
MTDTCTLLTSDDPRVSLAVPKSALVTNSTFFRSMLLDSPALTGGSIEVTETEEELETFVEVVQGRTEVLEGLDAEGWKNLAKLADKYQCELVTALVKGKIWELNSTKAQGNLAFALATTLDDSSLCARTGQGLVAEGTVGRSSKLIDMVWNERLLTEWANIGRSFLDSFSPQTPFRTAIVKSLSTSDYSICCKHVVYLVVEADMRDEDYLNSLPPFPMA